MAWAGALAWLWLAAAPSPVHAATVYTGFTGPFAPAYFQGVTNLGSATMDSTAIVITGPGGGASLRDSTDAMWYRGPSNSGLTNGPAVVQFHWQLWASNSMAADAFVNVYDSGNNLIGQETLGSTTYGGGTVQGDSQIYVPQFGSFVFGLNGMIYKSAPAALNISSFVATVVPEASTWWAGGALLLCGGWRYWRVKRKQSAAAAAVK